MKGTIWCLHGAVGMAADWRGLAVPGWAVKRVDLWRFLDCCPMSLDEFGRALNREAAASGGPRVLLGYSMGGRLALHALLADPGHWDAGLIMSADPGLEDDSARAERRERDAEWAARALRGDWREFLRHWNNQAVLEDRGSSRGSGLELADRRGLESRRAAVARSFIDWSLGAQQPLWERLPRLATPLDWLVGERDAKFRALGERAVGLLPDARLDVVAAAGHRVPWDQPEAFHARLGECLERCFP